MIIDMSTLKKTDNPDLKIKDKVFVSVRKYKKTNFLIIDNLQGQRITLTGELDDDLKRDVQNLLRSVKVISYDDIIPLAYICQEMGIAINSYCSVFTLVQQLRLPFIMETLLKGLDVKKNDMDRLKDICQPVYEGKAKTRAVISWINAMTDAEIFCFKACYKKATRYQRHLASDDRPYQPKEDELNIFDAVSLF